MSQTEEKYQVDVKKTEKDYNSFSEIVLCRQCVDTHTHIFLTIIITVIIAGMSIPAIFEVMPPESFDKLKPVEKFFLIPTATFAIIFYLIKFLIRYISRSANAGNVLPNGSFSCGKTFAIDSEGIQEQSDFEISRTKWQGVITIENHQKYILFYVDKLMAYVVPKSSFLSNEEAENFFKKAVELHKQAISKVSESKNPWSRPSNLQSNP